MEVIESALKSDIDLTPCNLPRPHKALESLQRGWESVLQMDIDGTHIPSLNRDSLEAILMTEFGGRWGRGFVWKRSLDWKFFVGRL